MGQRSICWIHGERGGVAGRIRDGDQIIRGQAEDRGVGVELRSRTASITGVVDDVRIGHQDACIDRDRELTRLGKFNRPLHFVQACGQDLKVEGELRTTCPPMAGPSCGNGTRDAGAIVAA